MMLELGGNAPFIVFADADFDEAIAGTVAAKLGNSCQVCISPTRLYVHDAIYDRFVDALADRIGKIAVGDGMR